MKTLAHVYSGIRQAAGCLRQAPLLVRTLALTRRRRWNCIVLHTRRFTTLPPSVAVPLVCGPVKGKLRCPPELAIVLIHNYRSEPLMERSLRYTGVDDFVVLRSSHEGPWFNTLKLVELKKFLDGGSCTRPYVLYCDSEDALLLDHPQKAIRFLEEERCDMLVSSTRFAGAYEYMPQVRAWADRDAEENGAAHRYLNAGVFVARTDFLREVVDAAMEYVTGHDLTREEYRSLRGRGALLERLTEFPKGIGSDQVILRYLHPRFHPRMKVDYRVRLAYR